MKERRILHALPVCLTGNSRVVETTKLEDMVLHYRECKSCKHRFFTKEIDTTPKKVESYSILEKTEGGKKSERRTKNE